MKIGIFLPTFGAGNRPEFLRALAETAEQVGAASLWAPEHVVLVDAYESQYPYSDDGRFPLDPSAGGLGDPFTVLSFLAAVTKTVRLGTGICLVPQRNPVYTAKMVAGLDVLSNGRVDFGVGIGWLKEEFDALEMPFERRAQRTRAYLEIMRRLWTQDEASYADEFYTLPPVHMAPKPVQQPHPPIIFGGESDPALRRVTDIGQGWFGWNLTPEMTTERLAALDRLLNRRGRSRTDVSITISPYTQPARGLDSMKRYRDLGVDEVVHLLPISETPDQVRSAVEWLGEHIIAPSARL
ncbi:MAG: LLM class F420-dependent oxidoreductase [Deltaproteobacteria bacterium]|nr:LLM class F420-dependent oxidoreductase [Deltaproteobacteria bacterium]MBI3388799.1 LLM class F420-dependent oxidoreductase [Deltaproteobacteria bacterium]